MLLGGGRKVRFTVVERPGNPAAHPPPPCSAPPVPVHVAAPPVRGGQPLPLRGHHHAQGPRPRRGQRLVAVSWTGPAGWAEWLAVSVRLSRPRWQGGRAGGVGSALQAVPSCRAVPRLLSLQGHRHRAHAAPVAARPAGRQPKCWQRSRLGTVGRQPVCPRLRRPGAASGRGPAAAAQPPDLNAGRQRRGPCRQPRQAAAAAGPAEQQRHAAGAAGRGGAGHSSRVGGGRAPAAGAGPKCQQPARPTPAPLPVCTHQHDAPSSAGSLGG